MQVTRILAVRHGETAWNRDTRIQGHTDIDLNDQGRLQARRLALALRDESLAAIYASDLSRARATAQAVADLQGQAVQTHPGLRERRFGRFEGLTWAEIEAQHPEEALAWGLVDEVVPQPELLEAAKALAAEIAENAPLAVVATRKTLRAGLAAAVRAQTDHEHGQQTILRATEDFAEGVRAVAERRPGNFKGR